MTHRIDKRFDFCYGHRVWTQNLNADYCATGENETKCKHMHGHEGSVHIFLESDTLVDGFVTDFKHLGWLKDFINTFMDHKFIIDVNDPAFYSIVNASTRVAMVDGENRPVLQSNDFDDLIELLPVAPDGKTRGFYVGAVNNLIGYQKELLEGFLFVDFVPTSENLSKWIFEIVDDKMSKIGVTTTRVDWFETPKSRSTYIK